MSREYNIIQTEDKTLLDYCQECQSYHQVIIINQQLLLAPCENKIYQQFPNQEKIVTETNVTNRYSHTPSLNSISNLSIKNSLQPSNKPNLSKTPTKNTIFYSSTQSINSIHSQSIISLDHYSSKQSHKSKQKSKSKSKQNIIYLNKQKLSPSKINIVKTVRPTNNTVYHQQNSKIKPQINSSHQQNRRNAFIQNQISQKITSQQIIINSTKNILHTKLPVILNNILMPTSIQTPQFGSQSVITQDKQITSLSLRRKNIQKNIQNHLKLNNNIIQNRGSNNNNILQEDEYFCCGYLKKC